MISVVVPSYNERENVSDCRKALENALSGEEYEIIFVDDGSADGTWDVIKSECSERVRGIRFSRNFGKESAIRAGLDAASGDAVIVIDCDLQHPPEIIPEMIKKWRDGAKVVEGKKSFRGRESRSHGLSAAIFNRVMTKTIGFDMSGASDFILLDRAALNALLSYNEAGSFFRGLAKFVGFEHETVYYEVKAREKGEGKFTLPRLVSYALKNIASFTSAPLYLCFLPGIAALAAAVLIIILKIFGLLQSVTAGVTVILLCAGTVLISNGIIGYYLARIYDEIKGRPKYIISEDTKNGGGI